MYFQIQIFRNTIINWIIPASLIILVGIIAFRIDYKNYKETYFHYGTTKLYAILNYLVGYGFIACSIFMFTNYYFADQNVKIESYKIIDRTTIRGTKKSGIGKEQPVFTIRYEGQNKELVFANEYYAKMNFYETIVFESRRGFFGFDILENKKLN